MHLERVKTSADLIEEMAKTIENMKDLDKQKEAQHAAKERELQRQKEQEIDEERA